MKLQNYSNQYVMPHVYNRWPIAERQTKTRYPTTLKTIHIFGTREGWIYMVYKPTLKLMLVKKEKDFSPDDAGNDAANIGHCKSNV